MRKLLAAAGVAVLALLALLWVEIRSPAAEATAASAKPAAAERAKPAPAQAAHEAARAELAQVEAKVADADPPRAAGKKIDPASDEFFNRFDDVQPQILTRSAAKCYTGGLRRVHRNQKVKLAFHNRIVDGEVFVTDVKVVESTIDDPEMIACFVREVGKTKWKDDELPDWDAPDELVIRPERGMKKHTAENLAYEGEAGPT